MLKIAENIKIESLIIYTAIIVNLLFYTMTGVFGVNKEEPVVGHKTGSEALRVFHPPSREKKNRII